MSPSRKGALLGLGAAALFGVSAPLAKGLLEDVSPQVLAGLLYVGAGLALTAFRGARPKTVEAPLQRRDVPALAVIVLTGGVLGPLLMLLGLTRTTALTGSLLLNLEAIFTVGVAVVLFKEHLGRAGAGAVLLVLAGAATLKLQPGPQGADWPGVALLAGACAAWAVDNNLTQRLSLKDPVALVQVKTLAAGSFNLLVGLTRVGGALPAGELLAVALGLGALSYGVSVVLDAYALRLVGAAREAAYFGTAPFFGAVAATLVMGDTVRWANGLAMAMMAGGVVLLLRERHAHPHAHDALEHEHAHHHDEHHQHQHTRHDPPGEPHAHAHRHVPLVHDHPHVPDLHHRHRH